MLALAARSHLPVRMTIARTSLRVLALLALAAAPALAQRGGPPVLRIPAGTRALAMGDAGVALADVDALFRNPAHLAVARGLAGGASRYGGGATLVSVALAIPMAPGGLGLGVQHLDYTAGCAACASFDGGEGSLGSDAGPPASASVLTLAFGRDLDGVRVGVAGRWVEHRTADARGGALAFDVGVARRVGWATVAASAQNLGTRLRYAGDHDLAARDLQTRATLGVATEGRWVGPLDLSASAELSYLDGDELVPAAGLELAYSPVEGYAVAGRAGVRRTIGDGVGPLSLGAALSRDRVTVEYAFQPLDARGDLHRIGLRLRP